MSEQAEKQQTPKRKSGRSPAYPVLNVQKALERVAELHQQEGSYEAPLPSVAKAWGYSEKSSGARQTLATLRYYGLIDVIGDGDTRKVKVSETARRILLDTREDQSEKRQLIKKVALTPSAHKALFEQYPSGLASDGSVTHFLVFDEGFNKDAAVELLGEFKETASYVGLYEPDKNLDKNDGNPHNYADLSDRPEIVVGTRIQWTNQGVDQFREGGIVLGFSDDKNWIFTDQGTSGIPASEVSIMDASNSIVPPKIPPHLAAALSVKGKNADQPDVSSGSRKAVFPVEDGDVTLIYPENISPDGLEELGQYLTIFLGKEKKKRISD